VRAKARLARLERELGNPGCPACRDRRRFSVVVEIEDLPDGTVRDLAPRPAACDVCGEIPEQIIEIAYVVVTTREEVDRLADRAGPGGIPQRR
jgi:hypothetical protein